MLNKLIKNVIVACDDLYKDFNLRFMGFKWANAVEIGTVTVRIMNLELFDFRFRTWNFELLILSFQLWRAYSSLDTRVSIYVSNQNFQYVFTCISFKTCQHQVQTPLKSTNLWIRNIYFVPRSVFDCVTLIQMTAVEIIFGKKSWFMILLLDSIHPHVHLNL